MTGYASGTAAPTWPTRRARRTTAEAAVPERGPRRAARTAGAHTTGLCLPLRSGGPTGRASGHGATARGLMMAGFPAPPSQEARCSN
jgi:hypothetical protein